LTAGDVTLKQGRKQDEKSIQSKFIKTQVTHDAVGYIGAVREASGNHEGQDVERDQVDQEHVPSPA